MIGTKFLLVTAWAKTQSSYLVVQFSKQMLPNFSKLGKKSPEEMAELTALKTDLIEKIKS